LDWKLIQANPKVVLGFSDVTALLIAIYQKTGLVTFHGPTASLEWSDATKKFLQAVLFCRQPVLFTNEDPEIKTIALHPGEATGELIGGNLSVLNSLIGTDFLPQNWQNKILFIEDVKEDVYRIDRMLTHLKLAHILPALKGIIFGRFNQCTQKISNSFSLIEICTRATQDLNIPVLFDSMFGHQPHMFTLPIGAEIYLDSKKEAFQLLS
jgi:muramoyltetrapeptide carboxypeptidase